MRTTRRCMPLAAPQARGLSVGGVRHHCHKADCTWELLCHILRRTAAGSLLSQPAPHQHYRPRLSREGFASPSQHLRITILLLLHTFYRTSAITQSLLYSCSTSTVIIARLIIPGSHWLLLRFSHIYCTFLYYIYAYRCMLCAAYLGFTNIRYKYVSKCFVRRYTVYVGSLWVATDILLYKVIDIVIYCLDLKISDSHESCVWFLKASINCIFTIYDTGLATVDPPGDDFISLPYNIARYIYIWNWF